MFIVNTIFVCFIARFHDNQFYQFKFMSPRVRFYVFLLGGDSVCVFFCVCADTCVCVCVALHVCVCTFIIFVLFECFFVENCSQVTACLLTLRNKVHAMNCDAKKNKLYTWLVVSLY